MVVSGNIATVTTKNSQPKGRPKGFDPEFKANRSVPVSEVSSCSDRVEVGANGFTVWRSICTICPTM